MLIQSWKSSRNSWKGCLPSLMFVIVSIFQTRKIEGSPPEGALTIGSLNYPDQSAVSASSGHGTKWNTIKVLNKAITN
ncbi:hypothetical protein NPIL_192161 [Nephila pilipes]|uniref:Uncharacterized protein n=1 Tax=Nephila pilipes TaxID=299642 RepID=A0A8X6NUS9_NEPPI|nr:hypothetical protein NPIL_318561 [Nephila pilipes]GFT32935.1 hypothetical protein NPIL_192161 [Nephila pilipes]